MCGCLVAIAAMLSPRLAVFLLWAFTDRMSQAFNSFWIALLGWLFLPWTTLAWAVAYAPRAGVTGFGWFIVLLAAVVDVTTHIGSAQARRARRTGAARA
jgi:hypothetical protein